MLSNLIDRIKLPFRKEKELYSSLHAILGFYPHDISYYKLALMHKSVMRRNAKGRPVNNERLEFLGDAILDAIVGDIVYRHFPGKREGFLTNTRSKLVQRETLNRLAKEMGITRLVLSNGRSSSHNSYMGGNAFEALVGAIYLDKGYEACMHFMQKRILGQLVNIDKVAYKEVNFKSKLIEWSQKNRVNLNFENIAETTDQGGSPVFQYKIVIEGLEGCAGKGYSKKESQQMACKLTLEKLRKEPQRLLQRKKHRLTTHKLLQTTPKRPRSRLQRARDAAVRPCTRQKKRRQKGKPPWLNSLSMMPKKLTNQLAKGLVKQPKRQKIRPKTSTRWLINVPTAQLHRPTKPPMTTSI